MECESIDPHIHASLSGPSVPLPSLETILSSRLLLNLRQLPHSEMNQTLILISASNKIVFATNAFLGNIGAPVQTVDEEDDDDAFADGEAFEPSGEAVSA